MPPYGAVVMTSAIFGLAQDHGVTILRPQSFRARPACIIMELIELKSYTK